MKNFTPWLFLPIIILSINSCSSSRDFAGTYTKNNITGTGIGGHAAYNEMPSTKANKPSFFSENKIIPPPDSTLVAQLTTGENLTRGGKFVVKVDAFLLKQAGINDLYKFSATDYFAQHKGLFSWKEKLANKLYAKVNSKYKAGSAAGMSGASGPLGVVSLVFGILALVGYYGSFLFGLIAIITGALSIVGGARRPIMAILGIVFGVIAIVSWAVILATVHSIIIR